MKADAGRGQSLQVADRRHHAFTRESVERPAQNNIELSRNSGAAIAGRVVLHNR
jgi:hypothetical protein